MIVKPVKVCYDTDEIDQEEGQQPVVSTIEDATGKILVCTDCGYFTLSPEDAEILAAALNQRNAEDPRIVILTKGFQAAVQCLSEQTQALIQSSTPMSQVYPETLRQAIEQIRGTSQLLNVMNGETHAH